MSGLLGKSSKAGKILADVLMSPKDVADIRDEKRMTYWKELDITFENIWDIQFRVSDDLGNTGRFNINDKTSEYGPFTGNGSNKYNDYQIEHGNVMDENGNLVTAGETQIIALCDNPKDYLKLAIRPFTAHYDPQSGGGIFGWQKMSMACLEGSNVIMGVIDRSLT